MAPKARPVTVSSAKLLNRNEKFTRPPGTPSLARLRPGSTLPGRSGHAGLTAARRVSHDLGLGDDLATLDLVGVDVDVSRLAGLVELELLGDARRSEEHTSELQSRQYLVC